MVSQKSLSHSSRMVYAAPSLRLFLMPSLSRFLELVWGVSASSLAEVRAARGGLDGGEGIPEATSGIPLCPAGAGSGVVETRKSRRAVDAVRRGENVGLTAYTLAVTITRTMTLVFTGSHFDVFLPRLRWGSGMRVSSGIVGSGSCDWEREAVDCDSEFEASKVVVCS